MSRDGLRDDPWCFTSPAHRSCKAAQCAEGMLNVDNHILSNYTSCQHGHLHLCVVLFIANLSQENMMAVEKIRKLNATSRLPPPSVWTFWASHLHTIWRTHNYQAALDHWQISPVASNEENSVNDSIHAGKPWHDGAMVSCLTDFLMQILTHCIKLVTC